MPAGRHTSRGMTLIEIVVAVAIFLVVMLSATQIFTVSIRLQRGFLAKEEAMNETSYLMEYISRAVRMAQKDTVPNCLSSAGLNFEITARNGLRFMSYDGSCEEFYLASRKLWVQKDGANGFTSELTSPSLSVTGFNIAPGGPAGWDQNDYLQPRVTISMQLTDKTGSSFILQTTVSQRNPDIIR